jgi:hypothetical protein
MEVVSMAKADKEDLAAQAAKRAEFRVHHVGTKLNERELEALDGLLAKRGQTQGGSIGGHDTYSLLSSSYGSIGADRCSGTCAPCDAAREPARGDLL